MLRITGGVCQGYIVVDPEREIGGPDGETLPLHNNDEVIATFEKMWSAILFVRATELTA